MSTGVRTIDGDAFKWSGLEGITLPRSLENLGWYSLEALRLTSIDLPPHLVELTGGCFRDVSVRFSATSGLDNYKIVNNSLYSSDGRELLYYDSFASGEVAILDGVKIIGPYAFNNSKNLTKIKLPEGLEEIGDCFVGDSEVSEIYIPDSVKVISDYAFRYCNSEVRVCVPNEKMKKLVQDSVCGDQVTIVIVEER